MWSLECRHMYADVSLPLDNVERVKGTLVSKVERNQGIWKSPTTGVSVVDRLNKGVMFSSNLYFNESTFFVLEYAVLSVSKLSSSYIYCTAVFRCCLFLNFTSHFLFSEDIYVSQSCAHKYYNLDLFLHHLLSLNFSEDSSGVILWRYNIGDIL